MVDDWNISASQMKTYSSCPKWYEYSYLSDLEGTKPDEGYLALGSRVHESIEQVLQSDDCPSLSQQPLVDASIKKAYRNMERYPLDNEKFGIGMGCCESAAKALNKLDPDIRDVERRVEYQIDRNDFVTGVTAKMDVTTQSEIWDWKTGSVRDDIEHDEKIQGATYMAGYLEAYGEPPEKILFIYLKEGDDGSAKLRKITPSDSVWEYMLGYAKKLEQAKGEDRWRPDPGGQCYICDFEFSCPASDIGYGGVPYEQY